MQHKSLFPFLAVLCAVALAACDKPAPPPSSSATSVAVSGDAVQKQAVELPAETGEKADASLVSASATVAVTKPAAKVNVKALSMKAGLALAQKNHCLECHSIDKKIIGPAWMDVSKKYKGVDGIEDRLVVKVSTGGYGNWGNMPMPAMAPEVTEKDTRILVRFILSLAE